MDLIEYIKIREREIWTMYILLGAMVLLAVLLVTFSVRYVSKQRASSSHAAELEMSEALYIHNVGTTMDKREVYTCGVKKLGL